jgi:glycosyltransferase involved in cell wall biosynthesis
MRESPLVSVIIPSYNAAGFISETLDSALAQTYKNFEILVIDDGSTDNTKEVLEPYIKRGQIRYIYQDNSRQAVARNNGMQQAKGELLAFLDADDIWLPNKLELQVPLFKDKEVGLVYGNAVFWDGKKEWPHAHEKEFKRGCIFKKLMTYGNFIWASTVLIRRECADRAGLFEEWSPIEDYHMWLRVAYFYKADYTSEVVEKYRIHAGNVSHKRYLIIKSEIAVINDVSKSLKVKRGLRLAALSRIYFELSYFLISDKKYFEALKYAVLALVSGPLALKNWKLIAKAVIFGIIRR